MTESHTTEHFGELDSNLRQLGSASAVARLHARKHLAELGDVAVPPLVEILRSADRRQRWEAAKVLAEIAAPNAAPDAAPALVATLEDEDTGIRWVAAAALKSLGQEALPPILEALMVRADSVELRTGAERVLQHLCNGELRSLLTPLLSAIRGPAPEIAAPVAADNVLNTWRCATPERQAHAAAIESREANDDENQQNEMHCSRESR